MNILKYKKVRITCTMNKGEEIKKEMRSYKIEGKHKAFGIYLSQNESYHRVLTRDVAF